MSESSGRNVWLRINAKQSKGNISWCRCIIHEVRRYQFPLCNFVVAEILGCESSKIGCFTCHTTKGHSMIYCTSVYILSLSSTESLKLSRYLLRIVQKSDLYQHYYQENRPLYQILNTSTIFGFGHSKPKVADPCSKPSPLPISKLNLIMNLHCDDITQFQSICMLITQLRYIRYRKKSLIII